MTNAVLRGKPDAGNPHVRFDAVEAAPENPRRGSLLYKANEFILSVCVLVLAGMATGEPAKGVPNGVWTELRAFGRADERVRPMLVSDPAARTLIARGLTDLQNTPPDRDAWEIVYDDGWAYLLGSNPRSVMQATWDYLSRPRDGRTRRGEFALRYRIHAGLVNGMVAPVGDSREKTLALMRFLSYSGASHAAAVCDWGGDTNKSFFNYVDSEIFPKAASAGADGTPENRARRRARLRTVCDAAREYGLGVLFETILMPAETVYGNEAKTEEARARMAGWFSPDVLGYTGRYQGYGLCVSHPKVQAFYREITAKFLEEFPEIDLIHYITMDAGGDFCQPGKCPRCGTKSKADLHDEASKLLLSAAQAVRSDIRIIASGFDWERRNWLGDACADRHAALPSEIGYSAAAVTDPAVYEAQSHARLRHAREVTARAGQLFIGRDAFYRFDNALQRGVCSELADDNPRTMRAKIRRWVALGADGYYDVRGRESHETVALNGLFLRAALQNPFEDDAAFAARTAAELFGSQAAPHVEAAWAAERMANRIASSTFAFPSASPLTQYYPWFFGRLLSSCLPGADRFVRKNVPAGEWAKEAARLRDRARGIDGRELPVAEANGWTYFGGSYAERLESVGASLVASADAHGEAVKALERAAASLAADDPPAPFGLRALMGAGFRWQPRIYLANHLRFERLAAACDRVVGLTLGLNGTALKGGRTPDDYLAEVRPQRLPALREALRALDALIEAESAAGRFKRGKDFSKEHFAQALRELEKQ